MGENDWDYNDEFDGATNGGPADLRKAYKALQKQVKELSEQYETAKQENTQLRTKTASTDIASILREKGVNPALATRAVKDGAEPTPEGVEAWMAENDGVYNFAPPAPKVEAESEGDGEYGEQHTAETVPHEVADAQSRASRLESGAQRSLTPAGEADRKISELRESGASFNDIVKALKDMGLAD